MIKQDIEVSWITGITFSKRGSGVKFGKNFICRKLHISEIHLQQQILDTSKERLKNDH